MGVFLNQIFSPYIFFKLESHHYLLLSGLVDYIVTLRVFEIDDLENSDSEIKRNKN